MTATTRRRFCLTRRIPGRTARKSAYSGVDLWARLSRIWGKIGLIAAVVFATCGSADAEVLVGSPQRRITTRKCSFSCTGRDLKRF